MTDPRFKPIDFTPEPQAFGLAMTLEWRSVADGDVDRLEAARLQHEFACVIRSEAIAKYGTVKEYARCAGTDYSRLTQVLRGRQLMRLEDIAVAHRLLGQVSKAIRPEMTAAAHNEGGGSAPSLTNQQHRKAQD